MPRLTAHNVHLFLWISVVGALGGAVTFIVSYELASRLEK
jgi:hypothetical protein